METSAVTIHEALKVILDYQTHHRLREAQGRAFAEELNERVHFWVYWRITNNSLHWYRTSFSIA